MAVYRGYPWRFVVTDLLGQVTTWADGLFTNRKITFNLNAAAEIDCDVYPDDRRVNLLFTDGFRLIAQSNRLIYAFRRENPDPGHAFPWVCRAAGIIMSVEDQSDTDTPLTSLVAYDPWKYLEARPCVAQIDGVYSLPGPNGFVPVYPADRPEIIAISFLANSIAMEAGAPLGGNGAFIDYPTSMGGTAFYGTTTPAVVERCSPIAMQIQQGMSVAALWTELCDSGVCDIILFPIWDPINRPGYTHEVGIYNLAGVDRPTAIFGWDSYGRSTRKIDRLHSAVPGDYFNKGQYFVGQGGFPVPIPAYENGAAIADFLTYWVTQFTPSQPDVSPFGNIVEGLLVQAVLQAKQGKRTITIDTIPERSPNPLLDYGLGDRVVVHASDNLRAPADGFVRVETIPIEISDDGIEDVASLLVAPDWRQVGPIATASVGFGGINYAVGDTGTIDAGNAAATYVVTSIGGVGDVTGFTLATFGNGYMVSKPYWPTETSGSQPGVGSDFQVSIDTLS